MAQEHLSQLDKIGAAVAEVYSSWCQDAKIEEQEHELQNLSSAVAAKDQRSSFWDVGAGSAAVCSLCKTLQASAGHRKLETFETLWRKRALKGLRAVPDTSS